MCSELKTRFATCHRVVVWPVVPAHIFYGGPYEVYNCSFYNQGSNAPTAGTCAYFRIDSEKHDIALKIPANTANDVDTLAALQGGTDLMHLLTVYLGDGQFQGRIKGHNMYHSSGDCCLEIVPGATASSSIVRASTDNSMLAKVSVEESSANQHRYYQMELIYQPKTFNNPISKMMILLLAFKWHRSHIRTPFNPQSRVAPNFFPLPFVPDPRSIIRQLANPEELRVLDKDDNFSLVKVSNSRDTTGLRNHHNYIFLTTWPEKTPIAILDLYSNRLNHDELTLMTVRGEVLITADPLAGYNRKTFIFSNSGKLIGSLEADEIRFFNQDAIGYSVRCDQNACPGTYRITCPISKQQIAVVYPQKIPGLTSRAIIEFLPGTSKEDKALILTFATKLNWNRYRFIQSPSCERDLPHIIADLETLFSPLSCRR